MKRTLGKSQSVRSQTGLLATMLLLVLLFVISLIGAFAVDVGHQVMVQTELQNAVDAGALAGARDFVGGQNGSVYSDALYTTRLNSVDGFGVSNTNKGTRVKVDSITPEDPMQPGVCQIDAQVSIPTLLSRLFGNEYSPVNATAIARGYATVNALPTKSLFPVAVSVDTMSGHNKPLYACMPGESVTFFINSKKYSNAAFTGLTNPADFNVVNNAINQQLSSMPGGDHEGPQVEIGTHINLLKGAYGVQNLSEGLTNQALLSKGSVILPLISGDAPYAQSRPVDGFVGVHITEIKSENGQVAITATIVKPATKGKPGPVGTPTGIPYIDAGIQNISPGMVMLTSTKKPIELASAPGVIEHNFIAAPNASGPAATQAGVSLQQSLGDGSIQNNFNSAAITGTLWIDSIMRLTNVPAGTNSAIVRFTNQVVRFKANGQTFTIPLPDSTIVISPTAASVTTQFDIESGSWVTTVPRNFTENIFLGGRPIVGNLPGGLQNVEYSGTFSTNAQGLTLDWQWGAAPYSSFSTDLNSLNLIASGDLAGVPSRFAAFLQQAGGGTSSGGNNFTGAFSAISSENPIFQQLLTQAVLIARNTRPGVGTSSGLSQQSRFNQGTSSGNSQLASSNLATSSGNSTQSPFNVGPSSGNSSRPGGTGPSSGNSSRPGGLGPSSGNAHREGALGPSSGYAHRDGALGYSTGNSGPNGAGARYGQTSANSGQASANFVQQNSGLIGPSSGISSRPGLLGPSSGTATRPFALGPSSGNSHREGALGYSTGNSGPNGAAARYGQTSANFGQSSANFGQSSANFSQSSANSNQSSANSNQSSANSNQSSANSNQSSANSPPSSANSIQTTSGQQGTSTGTSANNAGTISNVTPE